MANIIAVIWDFDKTLIPGYMQDPIFEEYGVDGNDFWKIVNGLPEKYMKEQNVKVNADTVYLNQFIKETKEDGKFPGLNNQKLLEFGKKLVFYEGVDDIFAATDEINNDSTYAEYGIKVEHYIVSTGMKKMIEGSSIADKVKGIWACELIEEGEGENKVLSEIGYTIDNTTKTRAIFEINKGPDINVNSSIPEELRRVHFENMIYIADGPSDIPAFSLVKKFGGSTFAVYPAGKQKEFQQVEQLRSDGRVQMYAEADYRKDKTAYMWITNKVRELADRMVKNEREKVKNSTGGVPQHITK